MAPNQFQKQMRNLHQTGWRTAAPGSQNSGNKQFLLAFDDGYQCIIEYALPVMQELDFQAALFIPTGYIGRSNDWDHQLLGRKFKHLNETELRELSEAGWTIGSHTVQHRALTLLNSNELRDELKGSRLKLEDVLGKSVEWISFPFGRYDQRVIAMAAEAGYKGAVVLSNMGNGNVADFELIETDAVYYWDWLSLPAKRLLRQGKWYGVGKRFRRSINLASHGTSVWRKIFPPPNA
jgi:peptidoglycan/xylan/chitin deacetylase (PgdA/CDA1 family)